ncbi:hypothetical protein AAHB47_25500 [Bacillus wiedmannii]
MNNLPIDAKLKANKDTFFLPDSNGVSIFEIMPVHFVWTVMEFTTGLKN